MKQSHHLKTLLPYWEAVAARVKLFEVRRDDRGFQKGDEVKLLAFDGTQYVNNTWSRKRTDQPQHANTITAVISYVLTGGQYGIEPGYVVLGLSKISTEYK